MFHQNRPSRKPVMNLSPGEAWLRDCFPPESVNIGCQSNMHYSIQPGHSKFRAVLDIALQTWYKSVQA